MYDIEKIQDCLFSLIGWKNTLSTCEPELDPSLNTSETGQFYNDSHALLRLENLAIIGPSENNYNYPAYNGGTVYSADEIVKLDGLLYQSLVDSNQGNTPSTSPNFWEQLYPFSQWLEAQTKQSINRLFNSVVVEKKLKQYSKTLFADATLFDARTNRRDTETPMGRFVGFKLALNTYKDLKLLIDKIGMQFTQPLTDFPLYFYHSSQVEPIKVLPITTTKTKGSFEWVKQLQDIILEYWTDDYNTGGVFYIGYYEDDLPVDTQAINYQFTGGKPCASCNYRAASNYKKYSRFVGVTPIIVPAGNIEPDRDLWENEVEVRVNRKSFGINLSFSVKCDITDIICKNDYVFTNALMRQVQRDFANYMLNTNRTDELVNRLKGQALIELSEDGGQLEEKLKQEVDAIDFDMSDLESPCCPSKTKRSVSYGTI